MQQHFETISDTIEQLFRVTCTDCSDSYCKKAAVFFDLKDILYLYFREEEVPCSQVNRSDKGVCSHYSEKGCGLSRLGRPFICIWYFCLAQALFLREKNAPMEQFLHQGEISVIKALRKEMKKVFVNIPG
ncbi:MAG: hypothetical protein HN417_09030 [Desulfobacula sp.]|jgi:hypothetical protein|nr:hypothetical protein [Desulfobacula sp.]